MMTVDPNYENINLYHAYFERLFRMMVKRCIKNQRNIVFAVLEDLALKKGFIDKLTKFMHKEAICTCFIDLLIADYPETDAGLSVSIDLKMLIISKALENIESHATSRSPDEEKMENNL